MKRLRFRTEDSLLKGTLHALGCQFSDHYDKTKERVIFEAEEDVTPYLERLEANELIGSKTLLQCCKSARSAIFIGRAGR
jgi:hypothetical protein